MTADPTPDPSSTTTPTIPSQPDSQISHTDQLDYWTSQPADINGMLGHHKGLPQVSRVDLRGSKSFVLKIQRLSNPSKSTTSPTPKLNLIADVGAGIGRITKNLLLNLSHKVDIVEPVPKFTEALLPSNFTPSETQGSVAQIYNIGLESWIPESHKRYDVIWIQWCLGHLTDKQVTATLQRLRPNLADKGWIFIKENVSTDPHGEDIFDDEDSSVTRSEDKLKMLFKEAGYAILRHEVQTGFPRGWYPVKMYALRPK